MTLRQCVDRAEHISGEIKAARTVLSECVVAEDEQKRLYDIAKRATDHAQKRLDALTAERETLAHEAHSAIMAKGEPYVAADESADAPRVECEVIGVIPPNAPPMIRLDAPRVGEEVNKTSLFPPEDGMVWRSDGWRHVDAPLGDCVAPHPDQAGMNDAFDRATHPQDTNGKAVF